MIFTAVFVAIGKYLITWKHTCMPLFWSSVVSNVWGGGGRTFEEESKTLCLSLECCFDEFVKSATMSDPQFT